MKRQQYLKQRLQTLVALHDAVGAMRSLAAHHLRTVRQALTPARRYREEISTILAEIGVHQVLHAGIPAGLLIVASDLGLCGNYNWVLGQQAVSEARRQAAETIYSVGRRVRTSLSAHSMVPARTYDTPAGPQGITRLVPGLAQDLLDDYLAGKIGSLHVVSTRFDGVGRFTPVSVRVLPIAPTAAAKPVRRSPYVEPDHLAMVAVREFLYITLYEILLEAIAAEHGMRLMSAESAVDWLDNATVMASRRLASARSESSTQELLDIIAGSRRRLQAESS